jgi:hypothetical protein
LEENKITIGLSKPDYYPEGKERKVSAKFILEISRRAI